MSKINLPIYQIDAFADKVFTGNPAAVCLLPLWLDDTTLQNIALENNLSETAFLVKNNENHEIRWFTPTTEVDLCGHATLAAAYVLFELENHQGQEVLFQTRQSGELRVSKEQEKYVLDFPADTIFQSSEKTEKCFQYEPIEVWRGKTDLILIFENEKQIADLQPNWIRIAHQNCRGLIATALGEQSDFVSRFFAPRLGVPEDPVTGSAHTSLIPLWAEKIKKNEMFARQLSKRGGELYCKLLAQNRVSIAGEAKLYLKGEIFI
ncbi:MAG: PhzF family phenazine biosynthesis protein [Raineya sp.]